MPEEEEKEELIRKHLEEQAKWEKEHGKKWEERWKKWARREKIKRVLGTFVPRLKCAMCNNPSTKFYENIPLCDEHYESLKILREQKIKEGKYSEYLNTLSDLKRKSSASIKLGFFKLFDSLAPIISIVSLIGTIVSFFLVGFSSLSLSLLILFIVSLLFFASTRIQPLSFLIPFSFIGIILITLFIGLNIYFSLETFSQRVSSILPAGLSITFSNQLCMANCILTNFLSPSNWMSFGGVGKYCSEKVCKKVEEIKLGCVNCFEVSEKILRQNILPFSTASISFTVDTPQKDYCISIAGVKSCKKLENARNFRLAVNSKDILIEDFIGRGDCTESYNSINCTEVDPRLTPFQIIARFSPFCKSSVQWNYEFSYDYSTAGYIPLTIVNENYKGEVKEYETTTTPGPLGIGVSLLGEKLVVGKNFGSKYPITIGFVNKGRGEVIMREIKINVTGVTENVKIDYLLRNCKLPNGESWDISSRNPYNGIIRLKPLEDKFIDCQLDLNNINVETQKTFIITLLVNYTYKETKKDVAPIYVDTERVSCEIGPNNWEGYICNKNEASCISRLKSCYNNEECADVQFEGFDLSYLEASRYGKCTLSENGCYLYTRKTFFITQDYFFNITTGNNFVGSSCNIIYWKYSSESPSCNVIIDESDKSIACNDVILENCECLKRDESNNCIERKYDKCLLIKGYFRYTPAPEGIGGFSENSKVFIACELNLTKDSIVKVAS